MKETTYNHRKLSVRIRAKEADSPMALLLLVVLLPGSSVSSLPSQVNPKSTACPPVQPVVLASTVANFLVAVRLREHNLPLICKIAK